MALKIKEHLTNTDIYVCYGNDDYQKIQKKLNIVQKQELLSNGYASEITYRDSKTLNCYLVGINNNAKNIYHLKSTIVHELSHIVSYMMKWYNIEDDEFRSYLLAYLYEKTTIWIDKIIEKDLI